VFRPSAAVCARESRLSTRARRSARLGLDDDVHVAEDRGELGRYRVRNSSDRASSRPDVESGGEPAPHVGREVLRAAQQPVLVVRRPSHWGDAGPVLGRVGGAEVGDTERPRAMVGEPTEERLDDLTGRRSSRSSKKKSPATPIPRRSSGFPIADVAGAPVLATENGSSASKPTSASVMWAASRAAGPWSDGVLGVCGGDDALDRDRTGRLAAARRRR